VRPRGNVHAEKPETTRREGIDELDGPRRIKPRDEEPSRRSGRYRIREQPPSEERQRASDIRSYHAASQYPRGLVTQKRPVYENDRHEKGVKGCRTIFIPEDGSELRSGQNGQLHFLAMGFPRSIRSGTSRLLLDFDFRLVELAWDNTNNYTGGSNHGTQGLRW